MNTTSTARPDIQSIADSTRELMMKPNYQDATIMLQLAQWNVTSNMTAALSWLWSDQFIADYAAFAKAYPAGSEGDRTAALICGYFETIGTLYKHGLFNEDLLFDWLAVAPIWDKIKSYALGRRQCIGIATLWANFEALAVAHKRLLGEYST